MKKLQTEQIADFALSASYEKVGEANIDQLKRHLLDSIGSLLSCTDTSTINKLRAHLTSLSEQGSCKVPDLNGLPLDRAAQYYTALIRYPDFMDNYLGKEATCHPSDNLGALLAIASQQHVSGKAFLTAMAVAYQIECRLVEEVPVMQEGIDHTLFLSYSIVASTGRLLGLTRDQLANALAIAGCSISPMATSRASYTSEWKGLVSGHVALGSVNCISLAKQNISGPIALFEGPKGFGEVFNMKLDFDWEQETFGLIPKCVLKKYNAEVHTQSAIHAALKLRAENYFDVNDVKKVVVETFMTAYHITGSGEYGDRQVVKTKEQADHSMHYLIAVALIDGDVWPEQLTHERINQPDVQQLLQKIEVTTKSPVQKPVRLAGIIDPHTRSYPAKLMTTVTIHFANGDKISCDIEDYPGYFTQPMGWEDVIAKFRRLTSGVVIESDQDTIIGTIKKLENTGTSLLIDLLCNQVKAV